MCCRAQARVADSCGCRTGCVGLRSSLCHSMHGCACACVHVEQIQEEQEFVLLLPCSPFIHSAAGCLGSAKAILRDTVGQSNVFT